MPAARLKQIVEAQVMEADGMEGWDGPYGFGKREREHSEVTSRILYRRKIIIE